MCWAEKCCFFVPLNLACVLLGVSNFIISTALTVGSITCYFSEERMGGLTGEEPHVVAKVLNMDLKMGTVNIILSVVVIVSVFWMIFSVLLVVGIIKNEPSLVVCYFSFGIILTILTQLSGLLMLLNTCWWMALIIFIISIFYIHCLVVVHTVYELMQRGKDFTFHSKQDQDVDPLADCSDESLLDA